MNSIEACPIEEYYRGIDNRVNEATLSVGALYTVMYSLRSSERLALRYPTRLEGMVGDHLEGLQVSHVAMDADLRPIGRPLTANIQDGILNFNELVTPYISWASSTARGYVDLDTGYFLDYAQPFGTDQELHELLGASGLLAASH
jgi:hypothetical protein